MARLCLPSSSGIRFGAFIFSLPSLFAEKKMVYIYGIRDIHIDTHNLKLCFKYKLEIRVNFFSVLTLIMIIFQKINDFKKIQKKNSGYVDIDLTIDR